MPELRLLSLLSSGTEILHALGLGGFQIGRSHECDFPPEVAALPICSRPTFPVDGSSQEIDRLVKERLATAASIYAIDSALVKQLRPTHVITQTQCKVCAVSLEDVERDLQEETETAARIVPLEPHTLDDLWADIRRVAAACDYRSAGESLIALLRQRIESMANLAQQSQTRPRIAAIEWLEPLMAAGNWIPELIEKAAGQNLFGIAGQHSPWMTWDELAASDPDIIVALPCGFDLARTRQEMRWLTNRPEWGTLSAVQAGKIFLCDGNQFMSRPGPRLVESLQIFAEILHPELFEPSLEHIGWERLYAV